MPRIEVEVTHPDRVMFPCPSTRVGITKRELVDYYGEVADTMLPHLKGRALTVQRFPRGIGEQGFVQQDFADSLPDWMGRVEVAKEGGIVVHPVAERPEALRWLANQNCIALHVWQSRRDRLHNPDRLVFDLDPSDTDFAVVRATARAVAGVLDDLGLACYVQTTGSRGLHVVVPCAPTPTSTPQGSSPATSPRWWWPTTPRTARWRPARTSEAAGCISTSCETPTRRPRLHRIRSGPAAVRRWRPRWSGTSWTRADCGRTDSRSAIFPNGLPGRAIRGPACTGTPAH